MKNLTNLLGPDLRIKSVTKEAINNLRLSGLVAYSLLTHPFWQAFVFILALKKKLE